MGALILVADNAKTTRELMVAALMREGLDVVGARDGADVITQCREHHPALLLCNAMLFGTEAPNWCHQARDAANGLRIVLLVGMGEIDPAHPEDLALELGSDAVLPRPFRFPSMHELLLRFGLAVERPKSRSHPPPSFSIPVPDSAGFGIQLVAAPEPPAMLRQDPPTPRSSSTRPRIDHLEVPSASLPIPVPHIAPAVASPAPAHENSALTATPELVLDDIVADSETETAPPMAAVATDAQRDVESVLAELPLDEIEVDAETTTAVGVDPATTTESSGRPAFFAAQPPTALPQPPQSKSAPPTYALSGQLQETPLPRILFELYVSTFCGKLRLYRLGSARVVYLWGGLPVRVDSDQVEESLGRLLLAHGRIVQEQYDRLVAIMSGDQHDEATLLLENEYITKGELLDILRDQTERRLANSFSWRDGSYSIEADSLFGETMIQTEVHPIRSIWRGVSENYDLVSLMTYFASLRGRYAVATEQFPLHYDTLGPFLRNLDIATLLDGKTTFEGVLRSDDARALGIAQALYVLLVTDMVRASPTPGAPAKAPESSDTDLVPRAPADYRAITRVCDEVNREYLRLKECGHLEALRVQRDASEEAVDTAYANLTRPFTLESLPTGLPEDVQRRAAEICSILARARNVLRNHEQKERYLAGEHDQPIETLDAAATTDAGDVQAHAGGEQKREARQLAERAYADAMRLFNAQDFEVAGQKLAVALRLNPREPSYQVALARCLLAPAEADDDARQQAASLLQQALTLEPSHVDANFELAKLLVAAGQALAARPHIMRVLQRAPEHREARALLVGKLTR